MRLFANGLRTGLRNLQQDEKDEITKIAEELKIPRDKFTFVDFGFTRYNEKEDVVEIGSNIIPDIVYGNKLRDKLSIKAVLAHEYYGHRKYRDEYLRDKNITPDYEDEFRASYSASKCIYLDTTDKSMLLRDALDRLCEAQLNIDNRQQIFIKYEVTAAEQIDMI